MAIFKIAYWLALVVETIVRTPFARAQRGAARTEQHVSLTEKILLGLLTLGGLILPLVYSLTGWLSFADYHLPLWLGWLCIVLLACSVYVFACAHTDLKTNWSPSLEIFQGHTLITNGIYSRIRHPMYASQWITAIAQILLLQNWIAGPAGLIVFIPFYFLRVPAEEQMMLDRFGDEYRAYTKQTGAVFPKF